MNRQTMIALGIALVLGLVAVYAANVFLTENEEQAQTVPTGMTKVAVAAVPLEYGMKLTPDKVRFVDYPVASLPAGAYRDMNQLMVGGQPRTVLRPMVANEPILAAKIAGEGQGASIAYLLPDGMRAAAVRINDVSGVAGFIQPNDSVDVLITRQVPSTGQARSITDVLLQNIRVIALDQNAQGDDGKPAIAKTATLEVTPTDAQKLALAQQAGQLSLVLRKPGQEQDVPMVQTVSLDDLRYSIYGSAPYSNRVTLASAPRAPARASRPRRAATRPAATVAPQPPATKNVEVVRGTEGSNYEVGGYGS